MNRRSIALAVVAFISGCGGGGGDGGAPKSTAAVATTPAGIYAGTVQNTQLTSVVMPDNMSYLFVASGGALTGVVVGKGTVNGDSFTAANSQDFVLGQALIQAQQQVNFSAQKSFNGTLTEGTNSLSFNLNYISLYDTPVNASQFAGPYTGSFSTLTGQASTDLTINSDLSYTGTSGTCSYAGAMTPSHGPVFNTSTRFGAGCPFSNTTVTGIAVVDTTNKTIITAQLPPSSNDIFVAILRTTASIAEPLPGASGASAPTPSTPASSPTTGGSASGGSSGGNTTSGNCSQAGATSSSCTSGGSSGASI